jgi:hypothetical protein
MADILRIADAEPLAVHTLRLTFSTGEVRTVDALPLVRKVGGPVLQPLLDET